MAIFRLNPEKWPDKSPLITVIVVRTDPIPTMKMTGFLIRITGFNLMKLSFVA
jgi:hypothetical protein